MGDKVGGAREPIPISKVFFGAEEREALLRPLESGWVVQGPEVARFEASFAAYTGAPAAVAVSSGSTALHLACEALGVGPGDEVIVPAFTWVATANAVEHCGGRAVFCDVALDTFNLDVARLEALISPRTVGVIAVHLFGLPAELDALLAVTRKRGLWLVEDAACALGASYRGIHVGTAGALGCFSFHPRKSITTGEGGMITTTDERLASACRSLRNHGAAGTPEGAAAASPAAAALLPDYDRRGWNARMTDLQGALGYAQMQRLPWLLAERQRCARFYDERLAGLSGLERPRVPPGFVHGYQSYVTRIGPAAPRLEDLPRLEAARDGVMAALAREGIGTRQGTHAPVRLSHYRDRYGLRPEDHPNAHLAEATSLALPVWPGLGAEDLERVAAALEISLRSAEMKET